MRNTRRYNVVLPMGCGLAGTSGLAVIAGSWIGAGAAYALGAAAVFAVMTTAIVRVSGEQHPYEQFGPANYVTTLRAMLTSLAAGLIGHEAAADVLWCVIGVTALATTLDGVDGWLARRTRMASGFGARFDMEVDAALILVLSVLVWQHGKAGSWVLLCGLMRYGFVAAGRLLPWLASPLRATRRGKAVAVAQLVGLGVALMPVVPVPLSARVAAVTLAALVWSFAVDIRWLRKGRIVHTSGF